MKNFLLALIAGAILLVSATAVAEEVAQVDLPEYAGKWYLTVIFDSQTTRENSVLYKFLEEDAAIKSLMSQVVYTPWRKDSRWVNETQWQEFLGGPDAEYPCVLLQAPASEKTGKSTVIFFIRGKSLFAALNNLPYLMQDSIIEHAKKQGWTFSQCNPGRRCPRRPNRPYQPAPTPKPQVDVAPDPVRPIVPIVPTIKINTPTPQEADDPNPIPLAALLLIPLGVGGALWSEFKKEQS